MKVTAHTRRLALRALAEGANPSLELLAEAGGRSLNSLQAEAEHQRWQLKPLAEEDDLARRIVVIATGMARRLEAAATRAAGEDGHIDKAEIDAVMAAIRGLEKLDEILQPLLAAKDKKNEEAAADVLDRINRRIVELAYEVAAGIVAARDRP